MENVNILMLPLIKIEEFQAKLKIHLNNDPNPEVLAA